LIGRIAWQFNLFFPASVNHRPFRLFHGPVKPAFSSMARGLPELTSEEAYMTSTAWVFLIIAVAAIIVAAFFALKTRSKKLRSRFGPEYDRTVREQGSTLKAERELEHREKRIHGLQIHALTPEQSDRFATEWRVVQEKFVDDPRGAVGEADRLVHRTMQARGYPIAREFEDRAADLSVEHAGVVEHYRVAHDIAGRDGRNAASTEELRLAMTHYRALFEDLLGRPVEQFTEVRR
jgi:hypothetical protein